MLVVALAACSSCNSPPPEPIPAAPEPYHLTTAPVPGFPDYRTTGQQQLQLDQLPATYALPTVKMPPSVDAITDEFTLGVEELPNPRGVKRNLKVVRALLPFPILLDEQTFKPEGMVVSIDGKVIPFSKNPAPLAKKSSWRITDRYLVIAHPTVPMPGTLKVRYPGVRAVLDRHDPARFTESSVDRADAFAKYGTTIDGETRHGLLLVAPTTASWQLTLPSDTATFEAFVSLEAAPIGEPASDGASVALVVVADGQTTEVGRTAFASASRAFVPWKVDLTRWAGKSVELRLVSDSGPSGPGADATFDWVFCGSPTVWGPPRGDVRRVVVVALDTTRPDHLSMFGYDRPTTPEVDAWADKAIVFDRAWSTAPRTRPSFRSSTTGRLPLDAVGATNIADVFAAHGFATVGFVANVHLQPKFDFDDGFDSWRFDGHASAEREVDDAMGWLESHPDLDSYVFVHIMDPHMVYDAPSPYGERFVTVTDPALPAHTKREQVIGMMKRGELSEEAKNQLVAEHDGELAYTSVQLGRLFDRLATLPGRTLVVLHSDHGEEFWEHGGFEHNHSLYDEVTRTVFALRPAGGLPEGRRLEEPVTLMDLAPTLYDLFGFDPIPPVDGRTLVPLLAGSPLHARPLPVGYLQYSHERWGVVWNDHKYILHTGTGREELYDLASDPHETQDIAATTPLDGYRARLHDAHGVPVGPGFRVRVNLAPNGPPLVLTLPAAPKEAGILDPESIVENRANVEWGDTPKKVVAQVGQTALEGNKLTFHPGAQPEGVLYVLFDAPHDAEADLSGIEATLGGTPIALGATERGRGWREARFSVGVEAGTVVVPPPTEAARMGIGTTSETEELCKLGYLQGEQCDQLLQQDEEHEPVDEEELGPAANGEG